MGWTDRETVAIIGGGHTLGRMHGNCPDDGTTHCKGEHTMTSGFEGAWTRTPSKWNHDYFKEMFNREWEPTQSPAGADQWRTVKRTGPHSHTYRLTSNMALVTDPIYKPIAREFARNPKTFEDEYADAWYKLVHRSEH